ncbi:MAG: SDR family oxidoreductase [Afipia sp.]|nr:SDR family oxidoreductase [Afipia sp.]
MAAAGRLNGKRAVVTGAGQGIGYATALAYAAEGASVLAISRSADKLEGLAIEGIETLALDVTDAVAMSASLAAAGPVDILFNGVGWVHDGTLLECGPQDWIRSFEVNVTSMYTTIRAVLPGMVARGAGSIINVASVASSITGVPRRAAYGASKGAVIGLTKAVARDVVATGVRCNALCPGTTETPSLNDRMQAHDDPQAARRAFVARQPMGRLGRPEEMAEAAIYLASDLSAFATGTVLVVDGGQTM